MTLSSVTKKARPHTMMDCVSSPESFFSAESYSSDLAPFAASPNSLHMYDQERFDMQNMQNSGMYCTGQMCGSNEATSFGQEQDFDLEPQFENSNSLDAYLSASLTSCVANPSTIHSARGSSDFKYCPEKISLAPATDTLMMAVKVENTEEPTLAELNMDTMDPMLMDDIVSIIGNDEEDMKVGAFLSEQDCSKPMEAQSSIQSGHLNNNKVGQVSADPPVRNVEPLKLRLPHSVTTITNQSAATFTSQHTSSTPLLPPASRTVQPNVAVVPPVRIKTEPRDSTEGECYLQKLLTQQKFHNLSQDSQIRQVMPVMGQKRPPPFEQIKTESVEAKWKEIEKFIHNPPESSALRKRRRTDSGSSTLLSEDEDFPPGRQHYDSGDDSSSSDDESYFSDSPLDESLTEIAKRSKQYFWQYNVQSKGPKGTRLKLNIDDKDPHQPGHFEDPVFDAHNTSLVGIRHGGKARKGDGNEISPNPKKLFQIGQQLYKLNRQINSFQASSDQPASVRNKSRKEKNKLASRACRLKKKAQHEANKVKLFGLQREQNQLLKVIDLIWPLLKDQAENHIQGIKQHHDRKHSLTVRFNDYLQTYHQFSIAGKTTEFVNEVIAKVEDGDLTGGLPLRAKT